MSTRESLLASNRLQIKSLHELTLKGLMVNGGQVAVIRGHHLKRWLGKHEGYGATARVTCCKDCGRSVYVTTEPAPNETWLSGEALAVNCESAAHAV